MAVIDQSLDLTSDQARDLVVDQNTLRRHGVGLRALDRDKASPGYTLFTPLSGDGEAYLVDLDGEVVHQWDLPYRPGLHAHILANGNLLYGGKAPDGEILFPIWGEYRGGIVAEVGPGGDVVWQHEQDDHHHDAVRLADGTTAILGVELLSAAFASTIKGGIAGSEHEGRTFGDVIRVVDVEGNETWTWRAQDHVSTDLAVIHDQDTRVHWPMANSISELRDGSLIVSFRNVSVVAIIDRPSGEVTWDLDHDVLAQQHHPYELENGNILLFDNGSYRSDTSLVYSRVIEVDRSTKEIVWEYTDRPRQGFYSGFISSAQRLPNGNTLIAEGVTGRLVEVTADHEVVWEYVVPFFHTPVTPAGAQILGENAVFRAFRYSAEQLPWLQQ